MSNKDMDSIYAFLKNRNEELKREIETNEDLIKFMEKGGYVEWHE